MKRSEINDIHTCNSTTHPRNYDQIGSRSFPFWTMPPSDLSPLCWNALGTQGTLAKSSSVHPYASKSRYRYIESVTVCICSWSLCDFLSFPAGAPTIHTHYSSALRFWFPNKGFRGQVQHCPPKNCKWLEKGCNSGSRRLHWFSKWDPCIFTINTFDTKLTMWIVLKIYCVLLKDSAFYFRRKVM